MRTFALAALAASMAVVLLQAPAAQAESKGTYSKVTTFVAGDAPQQPAPQDPAKVKKDDKKKPPPTTHRMGWRF